MLFQMVKGYYYYPGQKVLMSTKLNRFGITETRARFYFSIAELWCGIGQIAGGLILGRYIDCTRNFRLVFMINLVAALIGNLLYSLPLNVGFIIVGRFLCGLNESMQTAFGGT